MKNLHLFTLLVAGVVLAVAIATYEPAPSSDGGMYSFTNSYGIAPVADVPHPDVVQPPTKAVRDTSLPVCLTPAFSYTIGKVRLMGDEGTRPFPAELSVTELTEATLPPLDQGMVNVTDYAAGYRMLPDGMVFNGDISIVLPYDSTLLPAGFTPDDIVTYYYDVRSGRWTAIGRDSVSTAEALVYSKVNHFTDFINAVIKTPEMPETSAFTPTSIKELEAANPLEGLQLIQAPTANNSGTANLSYQLEIPAGRQGMQPNLALTYSSSGGNGWLGVGWDISVPSITVETRWGVPRYDHSKESEVYLYAGEQLVTKDGDGHQRAMPHRTNSWENRGDLSGDVQFYSRVEERFDSIVRHGSNPSNYWWSVTDRNGITNYYGKRHNAAAINPDAVLCDDNGNIAHWALTESVDPYGNNVRYYYSINYDSGVSNGNAGRTIYLDSIRYTGHDSMPGMYSVIFNREDGRQDVIISNRYGFKEVTAATLCNIQVKFNNDTIRTFFFAKDFRRESNYKTRLKSLIRVDGHVDTSVNCGNLLVKFTPNGKQPHLRYDFDYYDYPTASEMFSNDVVIEGLPTEGLLFEGADDGASALGATKGKSWSIGGTAGIGIGPDVALTTISVGGNFDYSRSQSEGMLTMIDLNGDGLADRVLKKKGAVYYRPQIRLSDTTFNFGDTVRLIGLSNFLKESGHTIDWGVQASIAVLSASGSWPTSESTTSTYFADINGDGLPDLVTENGPWFNNLNNAGIPTFRHFNPVHVSENNPNDTNYVVVTSDNPCDGGIIFDGKVNDSLNCIRELQLVNHNVAYDSSIIADLQSNGYILVFQDNGLCDVYKEVVTCAPVSPDPDMDAVKIWVAPYNGTIAIRSIISLVLDSSESRLQSRYVDGIGYQIQKNSVNSLDSNHVLSSQNVEELASGVISENDSSVHCKDLVCHINKNDILFFRLRSRDNHSFDKVNWKQTITYVNTTMDNDIYGEDARIYQSDKDFLLTGLQYFRAPKDGHVRFQGNLRTSTINKNAHLLLFIGTTVDTLCPINADNMDTDITRSFAIDSAMKVEIVAVTTGNTNWSAIECNPSLTFYADFNRDNVTDSVVYHLPLQYRMDNYQGTALDTFYHKAFGALYRGWGQFAYNNDTLADSLIQVSMLRLPSALSAANADEINTADMLPDSSDLRVDASNLSNTLDSIYNPLSSSTKWVEMTPNTEFGAYVGYGNVTYLTSGQMANTRCLAYMPTGTDETEPVEIPDYDSPVPIAPDNAVVNTIRKQSKTKLENYSFSAGFIASVGASLSFGENTILSDYMDLNGDRYPDFIGQGMVQYTMPWGGIGRLVTNAPEHISISGTESHGETFGASYSTPTRLPSQNPTKAKITFDGDGNSGSFSANLNHGGGTDETACQYMDINGDGLPDMLYMDGRVRLNNGYGFLPSENWRFGTIRAGKSDNFGMSTGGNFNIAQSSIGGGLGVNFSENNTDSTLMDFNGDGLPDKVTNNNGGFSVCYNVGGGQWSLPESIPVIPGISYGKSFSVSVNASATLGFTLMGIAKVTVGIQTSPFNRSYNRDSLQLIDINGDGYVDCVTSSSETAMRVKYNRAGKTNLLKKATNFTNSYIELDYALSESSYQQPQRQWNLAVVATGDTFPSATSTFTRSTIEYRNPHYDRFERISYGYDTVITRQYNTADNSVYRSTVQGYDNRNFNKRGWKTSEMVYAGTDTPYIETIYNASLMDMENSTPIGDTACPGALYVSYEAEITRYYEGHPTPQIVTEIVREYDQYRNVTHYINKGDTTRDDEYFSADISYLHGMHRNLISLPDSIVVKNKQGTVLQKRAASYDSLGKVLEIRNYISDTSAAIANLEYDGYGNVMTAIMPANHRGQRMQNDYTYDTVVHTYPVRIHNSFGYTSTADYDYRFGKPLTTTDLNGNAMRCHYDDYGRLDTLLGPNEIAADKPFTITMRYKPHYYTKGAFSTANPVSRAATQHFDPQNPDNPIETIVFVDGWGRAIQTQKDAEVNGIGCRIVSGRIDRDCFGRTVKQHYPFQATLNDSIYNPTVVDTFTLTSYDILDRPVKVKLPNGDSTRTAYGFGAHGGKTYFRTTSTDPNGIAVSTLTGTRKQQVKTIAPLGAVTTFTYDPLGQLVSSSDTFQHATTYTYDMLGRMVQRVHPDAGTDTYLYDGAGNVTTHSTQVLANANKTINYYYTYNRLDSIVYPINPQNNVRYTYGDSTASYNRRGRIALLEDASGFRAYKYGKLGEVTEEHRTFVLPNEGYQYSFKTQFSYDSWNRVQYISYPDGEMVYYKYNAGGMLESVYGRKVVQNIIASPGGRDATDFNPTPPPSTTYTYRYIDSISYNKFELKSGQRYGNGTRSEYTYDVLQRLSGLKLYDTVNNQLQDISYTYDKAGNIDTIRNAATTVSTLGGRYTYTYQYDSLYRLTSGAGNFSTPKPLANYALSMTYAADGRILRKTQNGKTRLNGRAANFNTDISYTYNSLHPHTLYSAGGKAYTWDVNGNLLSEGDPLIATRKYLQLAWDEENRMLSADMPQAHTCAIYAYDADGERFYRNVGSRTEMTQNGQTYVYCQYGDPVLYPSPYVVCTPQGYTKHYFVESERLASRLGDGTISGLNNHVANAAALAAKQAKVNAAAPDSIVPNRFAILRQLQAHWSNHHTTYWQHGDHLGSASWITDTNGMGYQHLQYMPWGEPLVDQRVSGATYEARYTFSGKERDEETGFSYFGSRYYNPTLSIWLSVDPMSDKYPGVSPYAYCANNPVRFFDPNGEDVWIVAYGAGYLNSESQGQGHDLGAGFKKNAEAYASQIKSRPDFNPEKDAVIIVETKCTEQLISATNTEYEQGKIAELTIFSHGYPDGVSLGGQTADEVGQSAASAQLSNYDLRELNASTMGQISTSNFTENATINLYGCNIGGRSKWEAAHSFAQTLADYMGSGRTVNAFIGPAEFTQNNGKNTYEGRMIRTADRNSQRTIFTQFKCGAFPVTIK